MRWRYSVFIILLLAFGSFVHADDSCTLNGKSIEYYNPNIQAKLDGHVECHEGTKKANYEYKNGEKLSEVIESPSEHHEWKYLAGTHSSRRDGKQIDYFPNGKIKSTQYYEKGERAGKEQNFYDNGQLQNIAVWGIPPNGSSAQQYGTISYHKNGEISYINCVPYKNANPDPKLCGFDGESHVKKTDGHGKVIAEVTYKNGVAETESTKVDNKYEEYGSNVTVGFLKEPKRDKIVEKKLSDGRREVQYLYADGKVKRHYFLSKDGVFVGEDDEYFPSGKKVRTAIFGSPEGKGSQTHPVLKENQCWWENGKQRFELHVGSKVVDVKSWWSNGKLMHSGAYNIAGEDVYWNLNLDDYINCEMFAWLHEEGRHQYFNEEGKMSMDCHFKQGKREGNCKEYDKDGVLTLDGEYKDDALVASKEYKDGKLVKGHEYYSDGSEKTTDEK